MKTIGLLGGMSWESTVTYYQLINRLAQQRLNPLASAKISLYSVEFSEIEKLQHQNNWERLTEILIDGAKRVENAKADFLLICSNTMNKLCDEIREAIDIPIIHIADAVGEALVSRNIKRVGLLGTKFTMEGSFYRDRLRNKFDIDPIIPNADDRDVVHSVIYNELCQGQILESSKLQYIEICNRMIADGADAIVLGCTEIGLLIGQGDFTIPIIDSTEVHAKKAVDLALTA